MTRSERSVTKLALADCWLAAHDEGMTKLQFNPQKQKLTLPLILLGTSLILSACGGGTVVTPDPGNPTPTQATAILGTLIPFNGQADNIEQQLTGINAPILSSGDFDLGLPSASTIDSKYSKLLNEKNNTFGSCTSQTITAPDGFKSIAFTTLLTQKGSTFVVEVKSPLFGSDVASYKAWWFATVSGTVNVDAKGCIGFGTVKQNLDFEKGWNVMDVVVNGSSTSITRAADQTPGRLTWKDKNSALSLSAQALNPYIFNPWAALRK